MGFLHTRDFGSFSPNRVILVPSRCGSLQAYFHQTLLAACPGDTGREVSLYCYRVSVSKRSRKTDHFRNGKSFKEFFKAVSYPDLLRPSTCETQLVTR